MARFNASTLLALVVLLVLISVDSCAALPTRRFATRRSIRPVLAKRSETGSLLQTVVHSLAKRWSATPRAVEYKHSVVVAARKIGYTQTTRQEEEEQYDEGAIPTGLWMPAVMKPQNPKMKRQEVIEQESMQNSASLSILDFPTVTLTHTLVPVTVTRTVTLSAFASASASVQTTTQVEYIDAVHQSASGISSGSASAQDSASVLPSASSASLSASVSRRTARSSFLPARYSSAVIQEAVPSSASLSRNSALPSNAALPSESADLSSGSALPSRSATPSVHAFRNSAVPAAASASILV